MKLEMNALTTERRNRELRFRSLSDCVGSCVFPCDANGQVDLDALGPRSRNDYLFARALVGRIFLMPTVVPVSQVE